MLTRPLTDETARPVIAATTWTWVAMLATLAMAALVGGVGTVVALGRSWLDSIQWMFPWGAVRTTVWVGVPAVLVASTWAATYASAQRHLWRVVPAIVGGSVLAFAFFSASDLSAGVAGLGTAWALAIPFDRWSRFVSRLGGVGGVVVAALFVPATEQWWWIGLQALAAPLAAGAAIWIADSAWKAVVRRR